MPEALLRVTDENGHTWDDPTDEHIQRLYAGLNLRCRFLILERLDTPPEGQSYLQIFLKDDLAMVVEYRDGGPDSHHRAEVPLPADRGGDEIVIPLLLGWVSRNNEGWRALLPWVRWDAELERPWREGHGP